jgi:hypothetical protein
MKRDKFPLKKLLLPILLAGLIFSETVNAGWAFAARKVIGRINQMTQDDSNGNPAFQFATVIIDAPAIKVYSTAVNVVSQNQSITIVSQDTHNLKLKVSEGNKSISLSVVPLSNKSSEIMISATAAPKSQDPSTSAEVDSILKICKQLNKVCKTGAN